MTNKKEHKTLRKALSLALAMLVSILGLPLAKPQQVSATETSDPKYLSSITMDATASSSWDTNYDTALYATLTGSGYTDSYTTESDALQISSATELAAFARAVNVGKKDFSSKYVKLTKDIDLGGTDPTIEKTTSGDKFSLNITGTASNVWVPIGNSSINFQGNFDGDGHEVSNMTVLVKNIGSDSYAGLFGYVNGGSIKNTGVKGNIYASSSSSYIYAGGLVGSSSGGSISDSYATGKVYAYSYSSSSAYSLAGGLVGSSNSSGSISDSYATGNVYAYSSRASSRVGGLVGSGSDGSISDSYATGNVYAYSSTEVFAGGLVGWGSCSISDSYATGNVYAFASSSSSSKVYAGGLVGYISSSISASYATGNAYAFASSSSSSSSRSASSYAGGLVGYNYNSSISNSYATGNAYAFSFSSSAASSKVYTGGLVGYNSSSGSITNSYSAGNVSASFSSSSSSSSSVYAGGLVGYSSSSSITDSYYYSKATIDGGTGAAASSYGTKLTMNQMTGTGSGRATDAMGFSEDNWNFNDDGVGIKYLPRLKVITYNETTNPVPKFDAPTAEYFNFKAPANLTYNGSAKEATVTSKISEIPNDKITIKYYSSTGTNLTSAPIDAGTYIVKIDVAACDKYEAQTDITADHWTFTIAKANPTIGSTSTTAAYKSGLILGNVTPPLVGSSSTAGTWTWLKSTAPISSAGTHYFEAKFKPTNSNYNEVTKCILVNVSKATLQASDFNFAAPSNLEYSADYKTATITRKSGIKGIGELTVKYFTKVNGELTPLEDSSAPVNVGTYYVGINVGDDLNYNSVSGLTSDNWNFTITPAGKHTYRLSNDSRVYLVTK